MKASNLLISNFSTTIEQALQHHIAVLLWSSNYRCDGFDVSLTPPTSAKRHPIYRVKHGNMLRDMITTILDKHTLPLTDAELKRFIHGKDAVSEEKFINKMF